jgi:hypothetical protein
MLGAQLNYRNLREIMARYNNHTATTYMYEQNIPAAVIRRYK